MFDCISNRLPCFKYFLSPLPCLPIFPVSSNESAAIETKLVFCLLWSDVWISAGLRFDGFRMRKPDHAMLPASVGNVKVWKMIALTSRSNQRNDSGDRYWFETGSLRLTSHSSINRLPYTEPHCTLLGSREGDELELKRLSGGFRRRLRNQNPVDQTETM